MWFNFFEMIYKSPSNIALIKFMGKTKDNFPINPSLSYTLDHLISGVELEPFIEDNWEPLVGKKWIPLSMNQKEQERFLSFFKKLKNIFHLEGNFKVRSGNNFPKNSGAASSASSFSALTQAVYRFALEKGFTKTLTTESLALISRQGSGSSCRSFFAPWCLWDQDQIRPVSFPYHKLHHDLILCSDEEKKVPSSSAHERVQTSPNFKGRANRAKYRLKMLIDSIEKQKWPSIKKIVEEEFKDMHQLFETSKPSFSYFTEKSLKVLKIFNQFWKEKNDGPLITMDAGPHVHLLYRLDQLSLKKELDLHLTSLK